LNDIASRDQTEKSSGRDEEWIKKCRGCVLALPWLQEAGEDVATANPD